MKYVAFVDILGFKNRIVGITHEEAVDVLRQFNQTVYDLWYTMGFHSNETIKGRTFSDSLIVYSAGNSNSDLEKMLSFLITLFQTSIINCGLPLRGGLALGNFDDINAEEFKSLNKGIIVGAAFIDAFLLESSNNIKGSKLLFNQAINLKIERQLNTYYQTQSVKKTSDHKYIYELKWGDLSFLLENNYEPLYKFIDLAVKSKWLDHYIGTLETFLIKESSANKKEVFARIVERLKNQYKYNDLDAFIESYLQSDTAHYTKRSFLAFIREKL